MKVSKPGRSQVRRVVDEMHRTVEKVIAARKVPRCVWGTVSAAAGQSCTFTQDGTSTAQTGVVALRPYTPSNGDVALGMYVGTDFFLIAHQ